RQRRGGGGGGRGRGRGGPGDRRAARRAPRGARWPHPRTGRAARARAHGRETTRSHSWPSAPSAPAARLIEDCGDHVIEVPEVERLGHVAEGPRLQRVGGESDLLVGG